MAVISGSGGCGVGGDTDKAVTPLLSNGKIFNGLNARQLRRSEPAAVTAIEPPSDDAMPIPSFGTVAFDCGDGIMTPGRRQMQKKGGGGGEKKGGIFKNDKCYYSTEKLLTTFTSEILRYGNTGAEI